MEHEEIQQSDLFALLPGVKGGRALVQKHGKAYMQELGRAGGTATRERHGIAYFRAIGRIGRQVWRDRMRRHIRIFDFAPGERQKIIPYLPAGKRRKKPIWVRFFLTESEE